MEWCDMLWFPVLSWRLGRQLDNDRGNYGVKTAKLAKFFANMYFKDRSSKSYQRLVHHTDPLKNPSPASIFS